MKFFILLLGFLLAAVGFGQANEKTIYINTNPFVKKRGECVTFKAQHYYKLASGANYTWYKYAIPLTQMSINSTKIKEDTMEIDNLLPSHAGQYDGAVATLGGREVTRFWIRVKGCEINERETPLAGCKVACEEICLKDWHHYKDKCYRYYSTPKTWEEAYTFCQAHGAKLATIADEKENVFVGNLLQSGEGAWIGLNDKSSESNYIWNYDEFATPTFLAWDKSNTKDPEPNNYNKHCNRENCVELKMKTKKWNDAVCNVRFEFVCERYSDKELPGWTCRSGKCYLYIRVKLVWHEAQTDCRSKNATLVTIKDYAENEFVVSMIKSNVWTGLNDIVEAGVYVWNDVGHNEFSNRATYFNWDTNEPNDCHYDSWRPPCVGEDCVQIKTWSDVTSWTDLGCDTKLPYVCEKSRDAYLSFAAWIAISTVAGLGFSIVAAQGYMEMMAKRGKEVKHLITKAIKPTTKYPTIVAQSHQQKC